MKHKKLLISLCSVALLLTSCKYVQQALTFSIIAPVSASSLALSSYLDDTTHLKFASSNELYEAFYRYDNSYDAIIFDLEKGIDLIATQSVPYRLTRVLNYGNCYLIGRNKTDDKDLSLASNIVSFNQGDSHYEEDEFYSKGIHNAILNLSYDITKKDNALIDKMYEDELALYQDMLKQDEEGTNTTDYLLIGEPFAYQLVTNNPSYHYLKSFGGANQEFQKVSILNNISDTGYTHYPSMGLFTYKSWETDNNEMKGKHENFLSQIDNMTMSLERSDGSRAITHLDTLTNQQKIDVTPYLGANNDTYYKVLTAKEHPLERVNATDSCSYAIDLGEFFQACNNKITWVYYAKTIYSNYYNGDKTVPK